MKRFRWILTGVIAVAIAVAAMAAGPVAGALAARAPAAHSATVRAATLTPDSKPGGCGTGHFCSYTNGDGKGICYNNANNEPSWSAKCKMVDSVFNNGLAAAVRLYYYTQYSGAWYCLGNGDYLDYMTSNNFNQGPAHAAGLGQPMDNHVRSSGKGAACS
jgi:hypothetical protein